ncbi:hypothetical protein YC2023_075238 [Brassica napus]
MMVSGHLLPVHHLPRQFRTLRHLRVFLGVLLLLHLICLHHLLLQPLHLSLSQQVEFIQICVCLHLPHTRDIQWRICSPSMEERAWVLWIPIDRRELIGNLLFFSTLIFFFNN